jgi:hypothetical protein
MQIASQLNQIEMLLQTLPKNAVVKSREHHTRGLAAHCIDIAHAVGLAWAVIHFLATSPSENHTKVFQIISSVGIVVGAGLPGPKYVTISQSTERSGMSALLKVPLRRRNSPYH